MAEGDSGGIEEYKNIFGVRLQWPCDMPDDMLRHCIDLTRSKLASIADWQKDGDEVVLSMKENLDEKYGPSWQIIVGKHFGSKVTHDAKHFIFFYVGDKAVLIFKCG